MSVRSSGLEREGATVKLALHPTKPFVIAELGTSCDASFGNIVELARRAVAAGASAIKLQDHGEQDVPANAQFPAWFQGSPWETREHYLQRQIAPMIPLKVYGPQCPVIVSPFSVATVAMLMAHDPYVPDAWKIASGQVTNHELIRACVETGKPILLSTGMTTDSEVEAAVKLIGKQLWCLMDCTSEYPCPPERVCLTETRFWIDVPYFVHHGFSDHTESDSAAAAVTAWNKGARVFERHVCFSQKMYGSDAKNACTLEQFEHYCRELDRASRIPTGDIRDENAERLESVREQFLVRSA